MVVKGSKRIVCPCADGWFGTDDSSSASYVGDGNALTPIGGESGLFTFGATGSLCCVFNELVAFFTDEAAIFDGNGEAGVMLE